ncbi:MAG: hypothetical protein IKA02_05175 [Clostridia bacterium]|nr:hypothetical protein [Clostridia bacterium]
MTETVIRIKYMDGPECEELINRTIKDGFNVKTVNTFYIGEDKGEIFILSKKSIDTFSLKTVIKVLGFEVTEIEQNEQEGGLFSFFKSKK